MYLNVDIITKNLKMFYIFDTFCCLRFYLLTELKFYSSTLSNFYPNFFNNLIWILTISTLLHKTRNKSVILFKEWITF